MRDAAFYASELLGLHKLGATERKASWRQSMAALARASTEDGPGPLEGLHAEALLAGVKAALGAGLADDLDWLAPAAAGAALYELAVALPIGPEQRELGRRVLARMRAADAGTFAVIARRFALGGGRGLASPGMRARVALVMDLPLSSAVQDGPLALALASRRDLVREWIGAPSTGSLPDRRLAARIIERAALEAARQASQGDDHSLRVFKGDAFAPAWERLLADRESLVWRHVAVARGLLVPWSPILAKAVEQALSPKLSPTEWRRAAASISAVVAVAPERGLELADRALASGLLDRDPGAVAGFIWGLARAADAEPEAATELFGRIAKKAGAEIAESVLDLRAELGDAPLSVLATAEALVLGKRTQAAGDDGAEALAREVSRDLDATSRDDKSVREHAARALAAFGTSGAKEAYVLAREALAAAKSSLDALEAVPPEEDGLPGRAGAIARRASLAVLRDLDSGMLEQDRLGQLLALGGTESARGVDEALDALRDRICDWILVREGRPLGSGRDGVGVPANPTASLRRLRALLHLADGDMGEKDGSVERATRLRKRTLRIARALLDRFEHGPPSMVRRTIIAGLGRSLDALVRVEACDVIDALLVVATHSVDVGDLRTLAEASMDPGLVHVLERYAAFAAAGVGVQPLAPYDELTRDLVLDASTRSEALRAVLLRLGAALSAMLSARSLPDLAPDGGTEPEVVTSLEAALWSLSQLTFGARARLDPSPAKGPPPQAPRPLTIAVSRVMSGADKVLADHVVASSLDHLLTGIPKAIGKVVSEIVWRLTELPSQGSTREAAPVSLRMTEALPAWLPARRTLGGFHVVRALGAGGAGSVFVVTRVEEKSEPDAERFALKVPEYSASAARSLSEAEFLKLFREEAGALIALPQHPNLARFVTFDAGSKPKPILVMELVEGRTLDHLIESRGLDVGKAVAALDDVLGGLDAMHAVGIGHLDLKPANVILRRGEEAVLVDFGLAGRHLRPGCATGPYGAPEVWGALDGTPDLSPAKADVYAFGCLAFEVLTGKVLFQADSEMAQIAMHVAHDGAPPPLAALAKRPGLEPLAQLLTSTLRRDARARPAAAAVRKELARIAPTLPAAPWPLS